MSGELVRSSDLYDVVCTGCAALHPLCQTLGEALFCMDRLNNAQRPCPRCGLRGQWALTKAEAGPTPELKEKSDVR